MFQSWSATVSQGPLPLSPGLTLAFVQEPESSASSLQAPHAAMAGWHATMPYLVASSNSMGPHDQQQMQQQKFFDAFQAAVDQHTGVSQPVCNTMDNSHRTLVLSL